MISALYHADYKILRVVFSGAVEAHEVETAFQEMDRLLDGSAFGFRLLTDLENVAEMSVDCAPWIGRLMDLYVERGLSSVVRVGPRRHEKDIGFGILAAIHYGDKIPVTNCASREEAERLLLEG